MDHDRKEEQPKGSQCVEEGQGDGGGGRGESVGGTLMVGGGGIGGLAVPHAHPLEEGCKLHHPRGAGPIAAAAPCTLVFVIIVAFGQHLYRLYPPNPL